jgi:hypothetical protein
MLAQIATPATSMTVYALFETKMLNPRTTVQDILSGEFIGAMEASACWVNVSALCEGYTAFKDRPNFATPTAGS